MAYTVVKGDTLGRIARDNGMTLAELLKLNPDIDNPNFIRIGQSINVTSGAPGETPATDYTDEESTRFNGLPGHPEIWKNTDTGETYAVFYNNDVEPPIPVLWAVPSEEVLKTYFGNKPVVYDNETTSGGLLSVGAIAFGDVADIANTTGDPWAGFTEKMDRAREVMPWLEDDEVFALIGAAYLEGRAIEDWELAGTEWYQTHNETEREWLTTVAQDPAQAAIDMEDRKRSVYELFASLGIADVDQGTADYIATKWIEGTWSERYAKDQIKVLTGSGEGLVLDAGLSEFVGSNQVEMSEATVGIDRVSSLYRKWLGPAFMPDDSTIREWAGKMRDDPEAAEALLVESLRGQRLALFPQYTDATRTYDDIAGPWKSMAYNTWGVQADDMDAEFQDVIRLNNATEAQKQLRAIGADRGYERVTTNMMNDLEAGMRRNVRGAV